MRVIVKFVYVRVHIDDQVFLVRKTTFLEKFDFLYSQFSNEGVYRSVLHQKMFES